jgi:predicted lipoprotein with Yx(FWY)xxD motif
MRAAAVLIALVVLAGCGGGEEEEAAPAAGQEQPAATADASPGGGKRQAQRGTEIVLADSEYGDMLYNAERQAIYVFELDGPDETKCFDECLEAWPPVLTKGEPVAGDGVDDKLLGTIERPEGRTQVTYAGQPLYYYAHEAPGEVKCQNVDLNGGRWWVVGADGEPLD